ncbi:hypothetical protein EYF80_034693 [Liparis tanakae]|uniref:Uncharacterized protein n=1 Tax=Liparis tanakae TaxID=230148 RepID=A0A4Z2GP24_9TELE|nr:hypothetical protein EYF80_034693 [Liparis tanakae]
MTRSAGRGTHTRRRVNQSREKYTTRTTHPDRMRTRRRAGGERWRTLENVGERVDARQRLLTGKGQEGADERKERKERKRGRRGRREQLLSKTNTHDTTGTRGQGQVRVVPLRLHEAEGNDEVESSYGSALDDRLQNVLKTVDEDYARVGQPDSRPCDRDGKQSGVSLKSRRLVRRCLTGDKAWRAQLLNGGVRPPLAARCLAGWQRRSRITPDCQTGLPAMATTTLIGARERRQNFTAVRMERWRKGPSDIRCPGPMTTLAVMIQSTAREGHPTDGTPRSESEEFHSAASDAARKARD